MGHVQHIYCGDCALAGWSNRPREAAKKNIIFGQSARSLNFLFCLDDFTINV